MQSLTVKIVHQFLCLKSIPLPYYDLSVCIRLHRQCVLKKNIPLHANFLVLGGGGVYTPPRGRKKSHHSGLVGCKES